MTDFEPTPEQRAIIECEEASQIVGASAGTGKTAVLVHRYLKHVADGVDPEAILTITFTKKAAAEMKGRIVRALRGQGRRREAQKAETGPIQTIHSFCERLLRENAIAAGMDPQFDILGEGESEEMLTRAIREALSQESWERPEADELIAYLAGSRTGRGSSPYGKLEEGIGRTVRELRGSGLDLAAVMEDYTDPDRLAGHFESVILETQPLPVQHYVRSHPEGAFDERLKAAYNDWGEKAPRWVTAKRNEEADRRSLEHTAGLMQLVARAWSILEREIEREQTLDFTELESRARRLIERSAATRERLARQYEVLLVDEAQDVNPIQHGLIEALGIPTSMLVGDWKQSIYGFRLADPEIFQGLLRAGDPKSLTQNLRSDPGILDFVDAVFEKLLDPHYERMRPLDSSFDLGNASAPVYSGVELWGLKVRDAAEVARMVRELIDEHRLAHRDVAILVRNASCALALQSQLLAIGKPCRITGGTERYYTRLEVRDLANTLRALGNPYDDFALLAMLRSPIVGLSMDAIALLAQRKPVILAMQDFESPIDEDQPKLARALEWFLPLSQIADRMAAWEVLGELFAATDYLAGVARRRNGAQMLANVRKLLALAAESPELGPVEYAEKIREIQRFRHREGDAPAEDETADVITIMTIHKAKGLEFPVVVVPQTHDTGSKAKDVEIDVRLKLVATQFGRAPSMYHQCLKQRREEREQNEELRLLYVAMTRARQRLCVVASGAADHRTLAKRVATAVGFDKAPPKGIRVREAGSSSPDQTPA